MEEQNKKSNGWAWLALIGGILAIVGQWSGTNWLPIVGGIIAVIGALGSM